MEFIDATLEAYAESHTTGESIHLHNLYRETHLKILQPRMLSGHLQGRFLSMIVALLRPKNILEIGTYTGYSALCLAEHLPEGGQIDTIDINEELQPIIQKYLRESGNESKVTCHVGDALTLIPQLEKPYDLVFIDADKENYLPYYQLVIDRLASGAIIIADNVLWSGKVLDESEIARDPDTKALAEFNTYVQGDDRVENLLLPLRDGLMVIRKR